MEERANWNINRRYEKHHRNSEILNNENIYSYLRDNRWQFENMIPMISSDEASRTVHGRSSTSIDNNTVSQNLGWVYDAVCLYDTIKAHN